MRNFKSYKEESGMISPADIQRYQQDGALCLKGVFDPQWIEAAAAGIRVNLTHPSPYFESLVAEGSKGAFIDDYCNWQKIPEFHDYVYHSPAGQIAKALMQTEQLIFYHEHVLVKEAGALKRTPWHQDQPYYPVSGKQICSIWMPIDPVPLETSLQFVRGSHNWDKQYIPRKFASENNYPLKEGESGFDGYEEVPDIDDSYEILSWALEPGDCVVFHGATLHGAAGNASLTAPRRVLSTRWLGDDARFTNRPWEPSPPITGGLKPGDPMACDTFPAFAFA